MRPFTLDDVEEREICTLQVLETAELQNCCRDYIGMLKRVQGA